MHSECEDPQAEDSLEGRYANYFKVGYNAFEFVLEFGEGYHEDVEVQLHTKILMTPEYAESLMETLQASLVQYRNQYRIIDKDHDEK